MIGKFFSSIVSLCVLFIAGSATAGGAKIDIEIKDVEKQTTLVVKRTIKRADNVATLRSILGKVGKVLGSKNITPTVPATMARYNKSAKEGMVDIEGGVIVPAGSKGEGEVVVSDLPAGKVAFAVHTGPYENLPKTYEGMKAALAEKGLKDANISWEIYVTDPSVTKPEESKTEVYLLTEPKK